MNLLLIGIGTGNPDHLTLQAIKALNRADLVLIPRKGSGKADLAQLRRGLCDEVLTNPATRIAEFDMPERDPQNPSYLGRVQDWHDEIARRWAATITAEATQSGGPRTVALLVWGDPALYDSSLRIAARLDAFFPNDPVVVSVIPGIMSLQALTAAHAVALNDLGAPFTVTTGRRLREEGWPAGTDTLVVMLDGDCTFTTLPPEGISIWWGAYLGMPEEITEAGPLAEAAPRITALRAQARARHGWIMDIYLLRRSPSPGQEAARA